jgi:hypothetical protein
LGGLVLNYIPVFNQNPVFDAKYVSYNPVHRLEARKPSVEDYEISISHNRSWFMLEGWRLTFVEIIDYMLQRSQIVVKGLGRQIDIEDPASTKYANTSFQSIVWMLIFDIVTMKRNAAVLQRYENNHCITTTKLLRSCI